MARQMAQFRALRRATVETHGGVADESSNASTTIVH